MALNGFMKMRTFPKGKKEPLDFAASMIAGQAHGDKCRIDAQGFSYAGGYQDGMYHGQGRLVCSDPAEMMKSGECVGGLYVFCYFNLLRIACQRHFSE